MAERFEHITVRRHGSSAEGDRVIEAGLPSSQGEPLPDEPEAQGGRDQEPDQADALDGDRTPFREATLEDLENDAMPTIQKGIIVLAVLAVAAFAAWYALGAM